MKTQVDYQHYQFDNYLDIERWNSYYQQIKECVKHGKMNEVMVIGVGDGIVPLILKHLNPKSHLTLVDYAEDLYPDICCDILELSQHYVRGGVDVVLCCQVLEHLKYDNFTRALEEIRKVLKEDGVLILSLPDGGLTFKLDIKLPKVKTWHVKKICKYYKKDFRFTGEHYWEVNGSRKYLAK